MEKATTILKGLVGSHAYGYANESSDKDYMSVYIAPINNYFGLDKFNTSHVITPSEDNTDYEFLKFIKLCVGFNPNVIPLLFTNLEVSSEAKELGKMLVDNRNLFVTKRALDTLIGYAVSQREKASKNVTGKLGEKRKALIAKYGYDVKAAAHTIRLLRTAIHLFTYNEVKLDCAAEICANYRQGKYSVEDFDEQFGVLKLTALQSYNLSTLPDQPDMEAVNKLCVKILGAHFYGQI